MICIDQVTKKYTDITAVNDVSLKIQKGHIYGLLGPNGAGKTTLINILCGLLPATSGKITIGNYNIIIYTTHYIEKAETLCNRIAIIDHGKIIAEGTNEELKTLVKDKSRYIIPMQKEYPVNTIPLLQLQGILHIEQKENKIFIDNETGVNKISRIIIQLSEQDIHVSNVEMDVPNLEMVFLTLTGRKLRD